MSLHISTRGDSGWSNERTVQVTHLHEVMERLPVRVYTHSYHILEDTPRLLVQLVLCTCLQQTIVRRPVRLDTFLFHAPRDYEDYVRFPAVELRCEHQVIASERGMRGHTEFAIQVRAESVMWALKR